MGQTMFFSLCFGFLVVAIKGQISTPQRVVVTEDTEVNDSATVTTQTLTESQTGGRTLDVPTGVTNSDIDSSTTEPEESDSVTGTQQNQSKAFANTKVVESTAATTSTSNTNSTMDTSTDTNNNNNNKSNPNATSNSRVNSLDLSSVSATILDINDSAKEAVFTTVDVGVTTTNTTASTATTTTTTTTTAAVTTKIASNGEIVVSTRLPTNELVQRPTGFSVTRIQTALRTPPIGVEPNKDQFMCYHGNCTDYQCHKAVKIYSMFHKVPCVGRKCQIEILQREDSFFIKFQCLNNSKECPCLSKVPNLQKMCCKTSLCNNHTLMCLASSSSSSATFVWKNPNLIRSLLLLFSFYQQH